MNGSWSGSWGGDWFGSADENENQIAITALMAFGAGATFITAQLINGKKQKQGSGGYGFLADKPRKRDDDEVLMLLLQ